MEKLVLSESILFTGDIPKNLKVNDIDYLNHILNSHQKNTFLSDDQYHYTSFFKVLDYIKYNTFIFEWVQQHFDMLYQIPIRYSNDNSHYSLVLPKNQKTLSYHQHNKYDFHKTMDYVLYYVADCDEAEIVLQYNDHKWKDLTRSIKLKPRQFHMFNSDINHYIINHSKEKDLVLTNLELSKVVRY